MPLFGPPDVAKLEAKRDVKGLIKALSYPKDARIPRNAIYALANLADARAVEPLIVVLRSDPKTLNSEQLRREAARALYQIGDPRAIPALAERLTGEEDLAQSRSMAAVALAMLGDRRGVPTLLSALSPTYSAPFELKALCHLRCVEAVEPLLRNLREIGVESEQGARFWLSVVDSLGEIGDVSAVNGLLDWNSNKNVWVYGSSNLSSYRQIREQFSPRVAAALTRCGQTALPVLVAKLLSTRSREAALALGNLGWQPGTVGERLAYAFARSEWAEAGRIGEDAVEPLLRELGCQPVDGQWLKIGASFGNGDADHRESYKIKTIVGALGDIGDARAAGLLRQLLSSDLKGLWDDGAVRHAAAGALESIEKRSSAS